MLLYVLKDLEFEQRMAFIKYLESIPFGSDEYRLQIHYRALSCDCSELLAKHLNWDMAQNEVLKRSAHYQH